MHIDQLVQKRRNSIANALEYIYVFLALTHRCILFAHILQGYSTGAGAILPQCQ